MAMAMRPAFVRKKSNRSNRSIDSTDDAMPPEPEPSGEDAPGDPLTAAAPSSDKKKKPSRIKRLFASSRRKVNGSLSASVIFRPDGGGAGAGAKATGAANPNDSLGCDGMFSFIDESVQAEAAQERELAHEEKRMQPFRTFRPTALEEIAALLQEDVEVRDRSYKLKTYPKCFVGSEAVDYMVDNELAPSRAQAVEVGQQLMASLDIFDHVTGEHDFKDAYLFYRFKAEDDFNAEGSLPSTTFKRSGSDDQRSAVSSISGVSGSDAIIKMDKYGFLLDDERCSTDDGDGDSASAAHLARARLSDAKRWENILEKVPSSAKPLDRSPNISNIATYATTQSKVKYYARRGLPDGTRRRAWTVLTGVDLIMNEHPGEYEALVEKADEQYRKRHDLNSAGDSSDNCVDADAGSKGGGVKRGKNVLDVIERDIRRTFPKHYLFHTANRIGDGKEKEENDARPLFASAPSVDTLGSFTDRDDDSDQEDEDFSQADSDVGRDTIWEMATSTGQDPQGVVEAKKQLFNQSMNMLTQSMGMEGRGLENADTAGTAQIDGSDWLPPKKDIDGSDRSLDIFVEEDDDLAAEDSLFRGGRPSLDGSSASQQMSWKSSTNALGMGRGQESLRRVLRAYSVYDNEVGYCQGMNFIAAMFLTFLTEEEAFWLLVVVMNEEPYKLRELFGEDMAGTHEVLYIAEKLLGQFLPKLARRLEAESVHVSMFVTQWLLTVYTSTFPFELVSRVWDSFLVEGWKVVYRVMLALLDYASKDIMELKFEDILHYFRHLPSRVNGRAIMAGSLKIALKRKHIQRHVNEWRRHAGGEGESSKSSGSSRQRTHRRRATDESSQSSNTFKSLASNDISKLAKDILKKAPKEIVVEDLSERLVPVIGTMKFAVLLHNVLTPEECSELIDRAEEHGFEDASIYDRRTSRAHRNCTRYVADDPALTETWYERVIDALAGTTHGKKLVNAPWLKNNNNMNHMKGEEGQHYHAVGINERMRLLRYKQGQFFHSHNDAVFVRGPNEGVRAGEMSSASVHIYLNQKFKGGLTTFWGQGRHLDVKPRTGSILIFEHDILHEGQRITQGKKYIVRTDVMYSNSDAKS